MAAGGSPQKPRLAWRRGYTAGSSVDAAVVGVNPSRRRLSFEGVLVGSGRKEVRCIRRTGMVPKAGINLPFAAELENLDIPELPCWTMKTRYPSKEMRSMMCRPVRRRRETIRGPSIAPLSNPTLAHIMSTQPERCPTTLNWLAIFFPHDSPQYSTSFVVL